MNIEQLLTSLDRPLIDVRSESEFASGHIPGAINIPILNDDERKQVGTCYKQQGKEAAIQLGYALVEHQFPLKIEQAKTVVDEDLAAQVYCWRGGLRSKIFSGLLSDNGFNINRLEGGYKTYRNWALEQVAVSYPILVLGGPTGTGKTEVLKELQDMGEQVIDLEGMAHHRGSAYGAIGQPPQPTNEHFENELALILSRFVRNKVIWIENESRLLGRVKLPDTIYAQMRAAKVIELRMPIKMRVQRVNDEYGAMPKEDLIASTQKLEKRLGNMVMNEAINHLLNNEYEEWIKILLAYYDKAYAYGSSKREQADIHPLEVKSNEMKEIAHAVIELHQKIGN